MGRNGCPRGRRLQWEVGALEGVFSSALDPSEAGGGGGEEQSQSLSPPHTCPLPSSPTSVTFNDAEA